MRDGSRRKAIRPFAVSLAVGVYITVLDFVFQGLVGFLVERSAG